MDSSSRKRAIIGILLVVVGTLFLLDNLGFNIDLPWYLFRWPVVFIIIGLINLLSGNPRPALIFFAIGTAFYLHVFHIVRIGEIWPVILIIIGLSFIFRQRSSKRANETDLDTFDELAIFGGTEKKFTSQNLKGGKISCLFGGSEIDLRESKPEDGAVIEIFCMFGGVELSVPQDWKVNLDATAIFGGFSDERKSANSDAPATVHIKGFVMFGGGEIKN